MTTSLERLRDIAIAAVMDEYAVSDREAAKLILESTLATPEIALEYEVFGSNVTALLDLYPNHKGLENLIRLASVAMVRFLKSLEKPEPIDDNVILSWLAQEGFRFDGEEEGDSNIIQLDLEDKIVDAMAFKRRLVDEARDKIVNNIAVPTIKGLTEAYTDKYKEFYQLFHNVYAQSKFIAPDLFHASVFAYILKAFMDAQENNKSPRESFEEQFAHYTGPEHVVKICNALETKYWRKQPMLSATLQLAVELSETSGDFHKAVMYLLMAAPVLYKSPDTFPLTDVLGDYLHELFEVYRNYEDQD